mgnify:CR=1 FL=1
MAESPSALGAPVLLRRAEPADAAEIAKLLRQLGYLALVEDIPGRLAGLEEGGGAALVAANDGRVGAVATVHLFPALHAPSPVAHLTAPVVGETERGRGIGRRLVTAAGRTPDAASHAFGRHP